MDNILYEVSRLGEECTEEDILGVLENEGIDFSDLDLFSWTEITTAFKYRGQGD